MPRVTVPEELRDAPIGSAIGYHAAKQAEAGFGFTTTVYQETRLPHRVVEAARYRTAQLNGCITCQSWRADQHLSPMLERKGGETGRSFIGRGDPAPDEAFYADVENWRTSTLFSDRERLAIEFAERMGIDPRSFEGDEPFWEKMHANFDEGEIVDLTLSIGSWIALGRTLHILELDPKICPIAPPVLQDEAA